MFMDRHRCKLCPRIFSNGRALGGHMKSHLATLPLPPKKKTEHHQQPQLGDLTDSDSSSTHSDHKYEAKRENLCGYGLVENPKMSYKASDPEFLDAGSVVQDRESENESTQTPTRTRSKRQGQKPSGFLTHDSESKKFKPDGLVKSESVTESTPVSSVSEVSQDEEVALCLMMLSRDVWVKRVVSEENSVEDTSDSPELLTRSRTTWARFKCLACKKIFKTNRALAEHRASSKECKQEMSCGGDQKVYECPFCNKVFKSGQALGGHKRSHLLGSSTNINVASNNNNASIVDKVGETTGFVLDLNLPAHDEDHSQLGFL